MAAPILLALAAFLGQIRRTDAMATQRSLYDVLNVSADAEPVVIDAAYRALMKKYHPDQATSGDAAAGSSAAEINRAFAILRDPGRRADYDHREWTRRQAVHLAQSHVIQSAPRPRNAFGWGGWLVALVLGLALMVLVNGRGGPVSRNEAAPLASDEPDQRSQPTMIEPSYLARTEVNDIDREIAANEKRALELRRRVVEAAEVEQAPAVAEIVEPAPPPIAIRPRTAPPRQRARPKQRPGAKADEADDDFLTREGYIY